MAELSQRGKRKIGRALIVLLLLLLTGAGLAAVAYDRSASAFLKQRAEAALRVRIETIRAEGLPLTPEELDKWYVTPPPDQNAATVLQQAFALYAEPATGRGRRRGEDDEWKAPLPNIGQIEFGTSSEPLPAEMKDAIAQTLVLNEAALKLLHTGASMPACRYPIDLTKGPSVLLPHLRPVRDGASLLAYEMLLRTENGQSEAAIESARDCFGVAHTLGSEPVLISQLVRFGCQSLVMPCLERLLSRMPHSDAQLRRLDRILVEAEEPEGMTRAFVGERTVIFRVYEAHRRAMAAPMQYWPTLEQLKEMSWRSVYYLKELARAHRYSSSGLFELDVSVCFELRTAMIRASQLPLPEQVAAAKLIRHEEDVYSRGGSSFFIMPASAGALTKQARTIALLRAARGAITAERYRLTNSKLPDKLDAGSIIDPFNGRSLCYKKLTEGYVVYSVGPDLNDDGGDEKKDVTFVVER
jgi:hypothetical protein